MAVKRGRADHVLASFAIYVCSINWQTGLVCSQAQGCVAALHPVLVSSLETPLFHRIQIEDNSSDPHCSDLRNLAGFKRHGSLSPGYEGWGVSKMVIATML